MKGLNVLSEEGKERFKQDFFTKKGHDTLINYTKSLTKEYFKKKEADYPFKLGVVFGVPFFKYNHEVKNKDELIGRIKVLMALTGVEEVKVSVGSAELVLSFGDDKNGKNW